MNKIAITIAALIIISTIILIYQDERNKINKDSEKKIEEKADYRNENNAARTTIIESSKGENEETKGPAQDSAIGEDSQEENAKSEGQEYKKPSCNLVRPGNIQYVECKANYIKTQKISITISNDLGESISARLNINNCDTEKQGVIENNEQKEFIFYCKSENYFEEDIYIEYEIQNKNIEVFGVVLGTVSE